MALMLQRRSGGLADLRADAVRALKRFELQGHDVNSANPEHVEAYLQMRNQFDRIDGKRLLAFMASKQTNISQGATSVLAYWAVPKMNFPQGLPQDLLTAIAAPEDLEAAQLIGGNGIDHENYFIVDMCAPRERLGKNVKTLQFHTGTKTKVNTKDFGLENTGQPQAAEAPTNYRAAVEPTIYHGQPQAASQPQAATKRALTKTLSEPQEDPISKRRRLLSETFTGIREGIIASAASGKWKSNSKWCHDDVLSLIKELFQVLQGIVDHEAAAAFGTTEATAVAATGAILPATAAPGAILPATAATGAMAGANAPATVTPSARKLLNKVASFLANIFKTHPMFVHLHHFGDVFPKLTKMGATKRGDGILIELLAQLTPQGPPLTLIDMSKIGVVDRNDFRGTLLWQSYSQCLCASVLEQAHLKIKEGQTNECKDLLLDALEINPVPEEMADEINFVLKFMLDETKSPRDIMEEYNKTRPMNLKLIKNGSRGARYRLQQF